MPAAYIFWWSILSSPNSHTYASRTLAPESLDSPAGHAVHGSRREPVLEIRIRKLQLLVMYVDPDVYKAEETVKDPALQPLQEDGPERVQYAPPSATTMACVPQRYKLMMYSESILLADSAQPEGRAR